MINCDVAIIGGGPAGLAAAASAKENGAGKVIIIERDTSLGGILRQCIHPGFGLSYFKEELTGPEFAERFINKVRKLDIDILLETMVLDLSPEDGIITCVNTQTGVTQIHASSIILAMGCRERTRGNIAIPGTRPSGVYTAGSAQRLINLQNQMVGKKVVILGSGDIGMVMARRMTIEGAEVVAVVEIMKYLAGLTRNRVQCLGDFNIPLMLSHTVTRIVGNDRVEGVFVAEVDNNNKPVPDTEQFFACDTILLSVGLIPENELSRAAAIEISPVTSGPLVNQYMQTSSERVFACGNVVHVNDLADNVARESEMAGRSASLHALGQLPSAVKNAEVVPGENVRYICPHRLQLPEENCRINLYFRVLQPRLNAKISVYADGRLIKSKTAVKVNPGEMEHIELNSSEIDGKQIKIDVTEK